MLAGFCAAASVMVAAFLLPGNSDAASIGREKDMKTDEDGHVLVDLWQQYSKARSDDRPLKEASVLDGIMKESLKRGLAWDFYDSAYKWHQAVTSRNWKLRDSTLSRIGKDAAALDNPVVTYSLVHARLIDQEIDMEWFRTNVLERAALLKQNCSRAFYGKDSCLSSSPEYAPFITPLISNDYEYLLWSVSRIPSYLWSDSSDDVREAAENRLKDYIGDSYPCGAYLEYLDVLDAHGGNSSIIMDPGRESLSVPEAAGDQNGPEIDRASVDARKSALEEFAGKYEGKAIALYACQRLLLDRKEILDAGLAGIGGVSVPEASDYEALRRSCADFEKSRKSFKGSEKDIADCLTSVESLVKNLDGRSVGLRTSGYTVEAVFKNIAEAALELREGNDTGKVVHSVVLSNADNRYYLPDTVKYRLPAIPDGDYVLVCRYGKEKSVLSYPVFSLSLAGRSVRDSGYGIYAGWEKSGRPVDRADIEILSKGKVVRTVKGFVFDGFTPVQDIMDEVASEHDGALQVRCRLTDENGFRRCSRPLFLYENEIIAPLSEAGNDSRPPDEKSLDARIFKDRAAFNPGDSVQFKVVLFSRTVSGGCAVEPGVEMDAMLSDPDGKTVGKISLKTNEFGSAAGSFDLDRGMKGGTYYIYVSPAGEETHLAGSALTVDEFVLPTYTMEFTGGKAVRFSGDTVVVQGKLSGYSGHPVSGARIVYDVEAYVSGVGRLHGETQAGDDGTFEIGFIAGTPSSDSGMTYWYYPTVRVTDLTGETYEWSAAPVRVNPEMQIYAGLLNGAEGNVDMLPEAVLGEKTGGLSVDGNVELMSCDTVMVRFDIPSDMPECPVEYEVTRGGQTVLSGTGRTGSEILIDLSGQPSGIYRVRAGAAYVCHDGRSLSDEDDLYLLKTSLSDTVMDWGVENFFRKIGDGSVSVLAGVGDGEQWYVVEVYDAAGRLLKAESVHMAGQPGKEGSVRMIGYAFDPSWTDEVTMRVFGFRNSGVRTAVFTYRRPEPSDRVLPLEFTGFVDRSLPGTEAGFVLKTLPGVECAVTVYDKSTDNIRSNMWSGVRPQTVSPVYVNVRSATGMVGGTYYGHDTGFYYAHTADRIVMASPLMRSKSASVTGNAAMAEESVAPSGGEPDYGEGAAVTVREQFDNTLAFLPFLRSDEEGNVRFDVGVTDKLSTYYVTVFAHSTDMRNAVLGREMVVSLPVKVSATVPRFLYEGDRYCLMASVSNSSDRELSGDMLLYVYGSEDYGHSEPFMVRSVPVTAGAGSASSAEFAVDVPQGVDTLGFKVVYMAEIDGVPVSDAMFVTVPVSRPVQTLTESHSSVVLAGTDMDSLKRSLEAAFTGTSGYGAEYRETSLMDMLMESVPRKIVPQGKDVLSLTEAYYMMRLAGNIAGSPGFGNSGSPEIHGAMSDLADAGVPAIHDTVSDAAGGHQDSAAGCVAESDLLDGILSCRNSDGGFGWFEGFPSSPVITAVVLERFASLLNRGMLPVEYGSGESSDVPESHDDGATDIMSVDNHGNVRGGQSSGLRNSIQKAVHYLDSLQFGPERPSWYGGLSLSQYLYLRSMYPEIGFTVPAGKDRMKTFTDAVREYLLPETDRGLNDNMLGKARRAAVLLALSEDEAESLAVSFGLRRKDIRKLAASAEADILSITEYAVEHPSGGVYFPNAVMPFRGLLESEVYAHSLLCDLMQRYSDAVLSADKAGPIAGKSTTGKSTDRASSIADGVRLWLMLQKETQHWDADPAYVNAVSSVLAGSAAVKAARIAVMTKKYLKPFGEVEPAGNGMTVERQWYRIVSDVPEQQTDSDTLMIPVSEGDTLSVGDRIVAQYRIWSQENRSFVQLVSPYYASLRPVDQLSGPTGGLFRPVMVSGAGISSWSIVPRGYREVKADRSIYYFDVCPEEDIAFTEEFHVTQAGSFTAPAVTIECLYSPHYRANGRSSGQLRSE